MCSLLMMSGAAPEILSSKLITTDIGLRQDPNMNPGPILHPAVALLTAPLEILDSSLPNPLEILLYILFLVILEFFCCSHELPF